MVAVYWWLERIIYYGPYLEILEGRRVGAILQLLTPLEDTCRILGLTTFNSLLLVGLGGLFCQLNGPEQGGLITMI